METKTTAVISRKAATRMSRSGSLSRNCWLVRLGSDQAGLAEEKILESENRLVLVAENLFFEVHV